MDLVDVLVNKILKYVYFLPQLFSNKTKNYYLATITVVKVKYFDPTHLNSLCNANHYALIRIKSLGAFLKRSVNNITIT